MDLAVCQDCGRTWAAKGEAHCATCCSHFSSDSAFDRHLAAPQSTDLCYDPNTLRDRKGRRVFVSVERKSGQMWMVRDDRPNPFGKDSGKRQEAAKLTFLGKEATA